MMESYWTLQRKSKRKVAEFLSASDAAMDDEEFHDSTSTSNTSCYSKIPKLSDTGGTQETTLGALEGESTTESEDNSSEIADDGSIAQINNVLEEEKCSVEKETMQSLLCNWAIHHNISHVALKDLLSILNEHYDTDLPSDPRTLCKTPVGMSRNIEKICGGEYYHFGLKNVLHQFLEKASEACLSNIQSTLLVKVNCDGIPLHKSSSKQFWPLLVQFCDEVKSISNVCVVGVFYGDCKPSNVHEYLKNFIADLQELKEGYKFHEKIYYVKIYFFVCDAPARQFLKCIIGHNGYSGCERCTQNGSYMNCMTYPDINATLRTDDDFVRQTDSDHHRSVSPLTAYFGMVTQFVLDPMHLLYLGVMRKLVYLWLKGPLNVRIGSARKNRISKKLEEIALCMPDEFSRKPRSLTYVERFKATEFRSFVLYTGPVCLADNLDSTIYKNFLLFSVAVTLMSKKDALANVWKARQLLRAFVKHFSELYGPTHLVYNVHNLVHIPDDVARYGSLDKFSAFCFENYLGLMKKMLRKPNCALSQIVNRMCEYTKSTLCVSQAGQYPILRQQHSQGPVLREWPNKQYKELVFEDYCIKTNIANQGVLVKPNLLGRVINIVKYEDDCDIIIVYKEYKKYEDLYSYPVSSQTLGIYFVSNISSELKSCSMKDIQCKYLFLPFRNGTAAFPLFHTD